MSDVENTENQVDQLLAIHRKPYRVFIFFNIDSEIRSLCYPNYRRREELMFKEAMSASAKPWLCQKCEKIPASCGKSIGECEHELWRENEYERSHP